ncbi:hypothetical protein [Georgenia sp. SUBG003]|uniref:hypothetical protein n=1 Tax=Georgenia sp. SUBG003 TaxID=1497974 RepID=UPI0004D5DFF9|nr:hypothetical protein DA06_10975 [Georgenia sp. SUBG003]
MVVLSEDCLYVANEGEPFRESGVETLLSAHISRKRGEEIGRFGLGFKSVTAISGAPQIFSRTVSFGFERATAAGRIRAVVPEAPRIPLLRLASVLDPCEWAESDPVLDELMGWAATVVRLPLDGSRASVREDMRSFPASFLLFASHVHELTLEDRTSSWHRKVSTTSMGDEVLLEQDGKVSRWKVFSQRHTPSDAALDDAGERARREEVHVTWAVPTAGEQRGVGEFASFFPIGEYTTLGGIVNAPWKLSDDRRTLLEGRFNEEMLTEVLPELVASSLQALVDPSRPEDILEVLPARGKEPRGWADDVLNRPVYERLTRSASLPGTDGRLHVPSTMKVHPSGVRSEWLERWQEVMGSRPDWVHHGVGRNNTYRSKAERLMQGGGRTAPLREWFEAPALEAGSEGSAVAMLIVAEARESAEPLIAEAARHAAVARREDGTLVELTAGRVFLRSDPHDSRTVFLDDAVRRYPGVEETLARLGIGHLDASGIMRKVLLEQVSRGSINWPSIWILAKPLPPEEVVQIIRDCVPAPLERNVKVRTGVGDWKALEEVFLPGPIVPASGRDAAHVVSGAHLQDRDVLEQLGAQDQPRSLPHKPEEPWFKRYQETIKADFVANQLGARPQPDKLVVNRGDPMWPMEMLPRLSTLGRVAITEAVLNFGRTQPWTVQHRSNVSYGRNAYNPPEYWWVSQHGMLLTPLGPWPVASCLSPDADPVPPGFPVPDVTTAQARRLGMVESLDDLSYDAGSQFSKPSRRPTTSRE